MNEPTAIIFDIQRNSYVDGPGIRTTVFFKGCNLRCTWCHNPESQSPLPETMQKADKTTECGKRQAVEEIMKEVVKDKAFYDASGGGVTFSGGECMCQIDFLEEILKRCKQIGIHTAVDTAGHVPFAYFERILPYTDLLLYDIKLYDCDKHKKYTGVSNELILSNFKKLSKMNKAIWVRIPIIPTINDTEEEMRNIKGLLSNDVIEKIELLPYHALGEHKYAELGKEAISFPVPTEEKMSLLKKIFL